MSDASKATPEQKAHWRLMEQLERAVDNIEYWQAEVDTAKKYLKKWTVKARRIKALVDESEKKDVARRCAIINAEWSEAD